MPFPLPHSLLGATKESAYLSEVLSMGAVTSEGDNSQESSLNVVQAALTKLFQGAPRAGLIERVSDRFVH